MTRSRLVKKLGLALLAVAVFGLSYYLGARHGRPLVNHLQAVELPDPEPVPPFKLRDALGFDFTEKDFIGFWNFVMAGDLSEPECRPLLNRYVLAWNMLAAHPKLQKRTRVVFLHTGAPLSDEDLRQRIHFYNPRFTAAQGSPAALAPLVKALGIPAQEVRHCDPDRSVVGLVDPKGRLLALFTGLTDPRVIARDLQYFQ